MPYVYALDIKSRTKAINESFSLCSMCIIILTSYDKRRRVFFFLLFPFVLAYNYLSGLYVDEEVKEKKRKMNASLL